MSVRETASCVTTIEKGRSRAVTEELFGRGRQRAHGWTEARVNAGSGGGVEHRLAESGALGVREDDSGVLLRTIVIVAQESTPI